MFVSIESDGRLVGRARKGDVEAFNHLVSRWEKRLYNYLLGLVRNREDALDISQEAFLKAYRSLSSLDDAEKFPQWLFRIAHNLAFSQLRRHTPLESAESLPDDSEGAGVTNQGAAISIGTARGMFGVETGIAVQRALEALSPEQREVIVLKVYQGFQFEEIAEILSCPVSTVKSRIYAGFALLRETFSAVPKTSEAPKRRR